MGYYMEVGAHKRKAEHLVTEFGARVLTSPVPNFDKVPEGWVLVCIVDNGLFEAAAICYNQEEIAEFRRSDGRPRTWVLVPREAVLSQHPSLAGVIAK